jgi:hypothetical protein
MRIICLCALLSMLAAGAARADEWLIEDAKTGTVERRIEAMLTLAYAGNREVFWICVDNLGRTSGDESGPTREERLRRAAAEALGRLRDARAVQFLVARYSEEKKILVKKSIVWALSRFRHKDALPVIRDAIASGERDLVFEGARAAAASGNREFAAPLRGVAEKSDEGRVRAMALYALITLGEDADAHASSLGAYLGMKDPELRYWAAILLAEAHRKEQLVPMFRAREIESVEWVKRALDESIARLAAYRE